MGAAGGGAFSAGPAPAPGKAGAAFTPPVTGAGIQGYPVPQAVTRVALVNNLPHLDAGKTLAVHAPPATNKCVRVQLLAASRHAVLPGAVAPPGKTFVVLDTRWTNIHPKVWVRKETAEHKRSFNYGLADFAQGAEGYITKKVLVDLAYEVPHFLDHAYLLADGLAYPMARAGNALPHAAPPIHPVVLAREGDSRELRFTFLVPAKSNDLAFRFFDFANGAVAIPVAGEPGKATGGGKAPSGAVADLRDARLDLEVTGVAKGARGGTTLAPEGWHFVTISLAGKSISANGKSESIVQVDPRRYLWVVTDAGTLRYGSGGTVNGRGFLRFTPEVYQHEQAYFLVPNGESVAALSFRDGSKVVSAQLGKDSVPALPAGAATGRDGTTLEVRVVSMWRGETETVVSYALKDLVSGQGVALGPDQFPVVAGGKAVEPDALATASLVHRPPSPFVVPPGGSLRFSLAYETEAAPTELTMQGTSQMVNVPLGKVPVSKVAPVRGAATHAGDDLVADEVNPAFDTSGPADLPPGVAYTGPGGGQTRAKDLGVFASEPDDDHAHAHTIVPGEAVRGELQGGDSGDVDVFRVEVASTGLYEVDLTGKAIGTLTYDGGDTLKLSRDAHDGRATIYDLYLTEGTQYLDVSGPPDAKGLYTLMVRPLGPARPNVEREPDDTEAEANPLAFGEPFTGRIPGNMDVDDYRLTVPVHAHVRISLQPPPGQRAFFYLQRSQVIARGEAAAPGEEVVWDGWLWPGDYFVEVHAEQPSHQDYRLEARYADPFQVTGDLEPNGSMATASPMPPSLSVAGNGCSDGDEDVYRLPTLDHPDVMTVSAAPPGALPTVETRHALVDPIRSPVNGVARYRVPAGKAVYLDIGPRPGPYQVAVRFAHGPRPRVIRPLAVTLALPASLPTPAAWYADRQQVTVPLTITATGAFSGPVHLAGWTSQPGWRIVLPPSVTVARGKPATVRAVVDLAPQAWGSRPVTLAIAASDGRGDRRTVLGRMTAECGAQPIDPGGPFPVPKALRGGLDVASTALGGTPIVGRSDDASEEADLFDGEADIAQVYYVDSSELPKAVTVRLAGSGPVPVAGFLLTPPIDETAFGSVRDFDLLLSTDGTHFTKVLSGTLRPDAREQAFVLPHPVSAHFARLVIRTVTPIGADSVALSELKVVAVPGKAGPGLDAFNIADPKKGGHLVWTTVMMNGPPNDLLTKAREDPLLPIDPVQTNRFVVGFWQERAAQIDELQWFEPPRHDGTPKMAWVDVAVSTKGPVGPWKPLGRWKLALDATGLTTWKLAHPVWARFVRFTVPPPKKDQSDFALPETLRIFERPQSTGYRSILGEWGLYNPAAIFEARAPQTSEPAAGAPHATRKTALELALGKVHGDTVERGVDQDWYRIAVPKGDNTLHLAVATADPSRVSLHLEDGAGKVVSLGAPQGGPLIPRCSAHVVGGQTYFLRVAEPERNVVFTWDTSGSVSEYVPLIVGAIRRYTHEVKRGRERVMLIPFGGRPILQHFSDDPVRLGAAIQRGEWLTTNSSAAETSLSDATLKLYDVRGSRAVMVITDADSTSYPSTAALWANLRHVRPRVFTEQVQVGNHPRHQQSLMEDWATVNHGHYAPFSSRAALDLGFNQASCMLRRPVGYRLTVTGAHEAPPPPGHVVVRGAPARRTSVELILDASGSMMSRLGRSTRIGVARHVLEHLVEHEIPRGTPVALRVYGQRVPRACRTDLVVPLSPLHPARMVRHIARVVPQDRSGTPIAASLRLVASDLAKARGSKIVILVTDGGESCHGDPAKAIAALKAKGMDVRINIVGFTIKDKTIQEAYRRWAALSGGRFFHASNEKDLARAVAASLHAAFQVVDGQGDVVAHGQVSGSPVTVAPGTYSVRVLTSPVQTETGVRIYSGQTTSVKLGSHPHP